MAAGNNVMKNGASAALLCGGASRRMGFDKAFLQVDGRYLLRCQADALAPLFGGVVCVTEDREKFKDTAALSELRVLQDNYPGTGPLGAVCTALEEMEGPYVFALACDMPVVDTALITELYVALQGADVGLYTWAGRMEPLFAFYHKNCLPAFRQNLRAGQRKLRVAFGPLLVRELALEPARAEKAFLNLNTQEDYRRFLRENEHACGDEEPDG